MLAHELRNRSPPSSTPSRSLKLRPDDRAAHGRMCEVVEQQVHHLRRLVDDLLDVRGIATGKIQLQPRRIDLASS